MTNIGIDPAIRQNGLAVALITDGKAFCCRFSDYNEFHKWTLGLPFRTVSKVFMPSIKPPFLAIVEDSNLNNDTFRGKKSSRNKYGALSRDAGKNMAVSSLIVSALSDIPSGLIHTVAPSQKGACYNEVFIRRVLKSEKIECDFKKLNDDELWAMTFALKAFFHNKTKSKK